jgi:hypothetical protein
VSRLFSSRLPNSRLTPAARRDMAMREQVWQSQDNPKKMLHFLRRRWSQRKLRLYLVAAFLPIYQRFLRNFSEEDDHYFPAVPKILVALSSWEEVCSLNECSGHDPVSAFRLALHYETTGSRFFDFATLFCDGDWLAAHRLTAAHQDPTEQWRFARLLTDIAGNPFRPVTFDPEWRTSTVVALAKQMYESRDFGAMSILADALQDAGCDSDDILDHCRGPGPHCRGCWVVDLVLGKA